ncbi:MAG: SUMF1/EgtB/PvdO family nonheme iron enzyme, partial [Candidatus Glassbacteria bacterium]|nr:SUMF1/EgtB/PvdO family nonheme iron enzyme [Candidatus Glassbacteria bacterium]
MAGNRTLIILAIVSLLLLSPTAHSLRHIKAGPASGPAQAQYKEDFNGDGNINITDAIALLLYQRSNPGDSRGDYNGDGKANMNDAIALLLAIRGGNLTPVEEPPEEEPEELDVEEVIQDLIMVPVPAGSFTIGEYDRSDDKVRLIKGIYLTGFQMSATEITQEQYQAVMGDNPAYQTGDYSSPVEQVSWVDAEAFCNRLSEAAGFEPCYEYDLGWGGYWKCDFTKDGFRLPTNCEWEYACRAETQANTGVTKYYNGDSENDLDRAGWYKGNSGLITHPVAQKEPNAWGLFDMLGNVGEWCEDWYPGADYNTYDVSKLDPVYGILGDHGPMGERPQRVVRGGTFVSDAQHSTSFERSGYSPERKYNVTGFRVVRRGERSIQGKVMKDGSGLAGISIRISGGGRESSATYTPEGRYLEITSDRFDTTLTTAEDGSYLLEGMTYGTYTLTPTAGGYDFDPVSIRFFLDAVKRSIEPIIAKAGDLGVVSDIVCFSDGGSVILNDQVALEIPAHEFWNGRKYEDSGKVVVRLEALEPGSLPLLSEMPVVGTPVELAFFYPDGNPIPADSLPSLRYPVRLEDMKVSFKLDNFSGDPENLAAVSIGADSVLRYLDTGYDEAEGWLSAELPLPKLCGPQLSAAGANPSPEWIWIVRQVVSSLIKITVVKMDNYFCKDDKWAKLEPPDAPDEKRIPVIFIHGYQKWNQTCTFYHATEPFPELREYLEKQSYIKKYFQLFTFTYPTFYEPKHNGMSLAARIADRFPTEGNDLVLVCHDMGGLVGRHYIEMEGGHNQVQLIITCGTPHLGTSLAILPSTFWPTDGAKSLVPGSDAIDELAKSADEISLLTTKYITYAGSNDWVVSVSSATNEDGSLWSHADRVTSRVFKGYDHDQMHTGNKNFAPEDDSLFIAIHNDLKNVIKKPLLLEYELSPETRWVVEGTVFKARYRIDNPNQIPIKLHLKLWFKTGKGKDDKLLVPADNSEDYYEVEMDPGEEWFEKPCMVPEGVEDNSRYPVSWDIYD